MIQAYNLSVVIGTHICNARCPFCVSKMTSPEGVPLTKALPLDSRRFQMALLFAHSAGVQTMLLTGKGEPTLYPLSINEVLDNIAATPPAIAPPIIELQTNGILFAAHRNKYETFLKYWRDLGLTTIALSVVHWLEEKNAEIYSPHTHQHYDLAEMAGYLRGLGFTTRLSVVMLKGYIDSMRSLENMIEFSFENEVDQLTLRPVNITTSNENNPEAHQWTKEHMLPVAFGERATNFVLGTGGKLLMDLPYGARIYDYRGQNICLTNCLTHSTTEDNIRQLIYFPDGHLRYSWEYPGAILF